MVFGKLGKWFHSRFGRAPADTPDPVTDVSTKTENNEPLKAPEVSQPIQLESTADTAATVSVPVETHEVLQVASIEGESKDPIKGDDQGGLLLLDGSSKMKLPAEMIEGILKDMERSSSMATSQPIEQNDNADDGVDHEVAQPAIDPSSQPSDPPSVALPVSPDASEQRLPEKERKGRSPRKKVTKKQKPRVKKSSTTNKVTSESTPKHSRNAKQSVAIHPSKKEESVPADEEDRVSEEEPLPKITA